MFFPVTRNVYRWETPDPEHGVMMSGHVMMNGDSYILIDPPMTPELVSALRPLGKCEGIVVTSINHSRGASTLAGITGAKYYFPKQQKDRFQVNSGGDGVIYYDEETELPFGIGATRCIPEEPLFGDFHLDEMELVGDGWAFIGDVAHGSKGGRLAFAPEDIVPNPEEKKIKSSLYALDRRVRDGVSTIFCGHGTDMVGNYPEKMAERKKELGVK